MPDTQIKEKFYGLNSDCVEIAGLNSDSVDLDLGAWLRFRSFY